MKIFLALTLADILYQINWTLGGSLEDYSCLLFIYPRFGLTLGLFCEAENAVPLYHRDFITSRNECIKIVKLSFFISTGRVERRHETFCLRRLYLGLYYFSIYGSLNAPAPGTSSASPLIIGSKNMCFSKTQNLFGILVKLKLSCWSGIGSHWSTPVRF